jgi:protein TonB
MICLSASAQDATPAATTAKEAPVAAMPGDPKELMLLAAKTNGLTGDDVQPWHLKGSWKMLDDTGGITDQGTYEEFWVSKNKFKRTLTNKTASLTEYGTEKGVLISDNEPSVNTHDLRRQWISPMPDAHSLDSSDYLLRQESFDGKEFNCLNKKGASGGPYGPTFCLDLQRPILIINEYGGAERTVRSRIVSFQDHYFAGDLQVYYGAKQSQTAHLDSIEALNSIDEAVFSPPSSAVPQKIEVRRVNIAGGIMAGAIVSRVAPEYPPVAKAARVSGTVVLQATISKEGKIESLHVISGPAMLQQAALDAVMQWVYRPYLLNNEPVEVLTTINVNFTLNR